MASDISGSADSPIVSIRSSTSVSACAGGPSGSAIRVRLSNAWAGRTKLIGSKTRTPAALSASKIAEINRPRFCSLSFKFQVSGFKFQVSGFRFGHCSEV
ncbi:hypothetical protein AMJ85_02260 [candidate division BRC1 bacterium SM23_51]|nr:MAG: hypothetical protein AMJ85_02260 [candidate division BRC1 bacterium SM23_51]